MSRQYNDKTEYQFELFGDTYELIEPTNLEELVAALHIRDLLQEGINSHEPDSGHPYYHLHRTQESWISHYVADLEEFDNTIMMRNITFLTKRNRIGIGELEKILGISTGYISRTAKGNSGKKMSIDNVWRIARLFGVELHALLETDLQVPNKNTELLSRFLDKLRQETEDNKITWHNYGGSATCLDDTLKVLPNFHEDDEECQTYYHAAHLNSEAQFIIMDDMFACKDIAEGKELLMVPYALDGKDKSYHVDFYFLTKTETTPSGLMLEKAFFTIDDQFGTLDSYARVLVSRVYMQEADAALSVDVRSLITDYLK